MVPRKAQNSLWAQGLFLSETSPFILLCYMLPFSYPFLGYDFPWFWTSWASWCSLYSFSPFVMVICVLAPFALVCKTCWGLRPCIYMFLFLIFVWFLLFMALESGGLHMEVSFIHSNMYLLSVHMPGLVLGTRTMRCHHCPQGSDSTPGERTPFVHVFIPSNNRLIIECLQSRHCTRCWGVKTDKILASWSLQPMRQQIFSCR